MPKSVHSVSDWLKAAVLYALPHHLISRIVFAITRWRTPLKNPVKRWFVRRYGVDMHEAVEEDPTAYANFNDFFVRAIKPELRPLSSDPATAICPVDGTVSQVGPIREGRIVQAKGRDYSVYELLGGSKQRAAPFMNGQFTTLYLSPRDYHRIHMPLGGRLKEMIHVPGRLFSVAPFTVRTVPKLFARNERVACLFDTDWGPMAMVLVGAINVAAIETVWSGLVTPPAGKQVQTWHYGGEATAVSLGRGEEMGRFNLGSTVILLFGEQAITWDASIRHEAPVRFGQALVRRNT